MLAGLITYNRPHLKTEQVLAGLVLSGVADVHILGIPFRARPDRKVRFQHRPKMDTGCSPSFLAKAWGVPWRCVDAAADLPTDYDVLIVGGAGLLPMEVVTRVPTINAHPGLIPAVRGLDAFKWAILDGMPLGVTLHLLDAGVDSGTPLAMVRTPVSNDDTLETLARRHYEIEITLLSNCLRYFSLPAQVHADLPDRAARKRMSYEVEGSLPAAFEAYRKKFTVA